MSPQWPPASVPWATMTSTPWATCRSACCFAPTKRAHEHAGVVRGLDHVGRWRPERVHEHLGAVLQRDLDLAGALLVDAEARRLHRAPLEVLGQRRHVVFGEHLVGEVPVLLRDHRLEVRELGFVPPPFPT